MGCFSSTSCVLFFSLVSRLSYHRVVEKRMRELGCSETQITEKLAELGRKVRVRDRSLASTYTPCQESEYMRLRRQKLTEKAFESIRIIGRGAFGEVRAVYVCVGVRLLLGTVLAVCVCVCVPTCHA